MQTLSKFGDITHLLVHQYTAYAVFDNHCSAYLATCYLNKKEIVSETTYLHVERIRNEEMSHFNWLLSQENLNNQASSKLREL